MTVSIACPLASATRVAVTQEVATAEAKAEPEVPADPRLSTEADWQGWERLGGSTFSPDGRWIAYAISRNDGTSELRLRVIAVDSTEVFKEGGNPAFLDDGKWLAFSIGKSDLDKLLPVNFSLKGRNADAEDDALAVIANAKGDQNSRTDHAPANSDLLVRGVERYVAAPLQLAFAPLVKLRVECLHRS